MTEPLPDTWHSRDLPVLRRIVAAIDRSPNRPIEIGAFSLDLVLDGHELEPGELNRALAALERGGYIEVIGDRRLAGTVPSKIKDVSGEAQRLAGMWPTPETGADRLILALEQIAENTDDEDERTRLQQFAGFLKSSGHQVGLSLVTAVLTGQVT